jgi:hypothetical protein
MATPLYPECTQCGQTMFSTGFKTTLLIIRLGLTIVPLTWLVLHSPMSWAKVLGAVGIGLYWTAMLFNSIRATVKGVKK